MLRISLAYALVLAAAAAQVQEGEAPAARRAPAPALLEWQELLRAAGPVDPSPPPLADLPQDVRAWSEALAGALAEAERATLFADGLRADDLGRAVALQALLAPGGQELGAAAP
ncbi:MAG: hypothetical protein ACON4Z_17380, partial [Planctomycetota bacterium]